jgi:hypothetical protein
MKIRFAAVMAATLFAAALTMAADGIWTGYISDSKCGVKGANDKAGECTTKCVQDKVAAHAGHHVTVKGTVDGETLKLESLEMAAATGK